MRGVDGDGRMQEQPKIAVIAGTPEAAFADCMARKVEFGRILDGQHVPPSRTLASIAPRGGQHLGVADRAVVEEAAERELLVAVFARTWIHVVGCSVIASSSREPKSRRRASPKEPRSS